MFDLELLPSAEADADEGYAWYRKHDPKVAFEFLEAVNEAAQRLRRDPDLGPRLNDEHRFYRLKRFPYYLVYRIEATKILVVAVSHNRRDAAYWQNR